MPDSRPSEVAPAAAGRSCGPVRASAPAAPFDALPAAGVCTGDHEPLPPYFSQPLSVFL